MEGARYNLWAMFYECRLPLTELPELHLDEAQQWSWDERWRSLANNFQNRDLVKASATLEGLLGDQIEQLVINLEPEQALLVGDVARALGHDFLFDRVTRASFRSHPQHLRLALQHIRLRCLEGRLLAAERELEAIQGQQPEISEPLQTLFSATQIAIYADMGRVERATKGIDQHLEQRWGQCLFADYEIACGLRQIRQWERATECFQKLIEVAPHWARLRVHVYHCLTALGQTEAARQVIEQACEDFPHELYPVMTRVAHYYSQKQWPELLNVLDPSQSLLADDWIFGKLLKSVKTDSDTPILAPTPQNWLLGLRVRALWFAGQRDQAIAQAQLLSPDWAKHLRSRQPEARRARVDVEPLVQDRDMCVAACVTMILRQRQQVVDPREIYQEMMGANGVQSWQLDRWLRRRQLIPVDVPLKIEAVRAFIDAGYALLATRSRIVAAHQELIVGYDDSLEELEIMEPSSGRPMHVPYEQLQRSYGQGCEGLVAIVKAEDRPSLPEAHVDQMAARCRVIQRALFEEDMATACEEFAKLPDAHLLKDHVQTLFPEVFVEGMDVKPILQRLIKDSSIDESTRLQAALQYLSMRSKLEDFPELDQLEASLPYLLKRLHRIHQARSRGQWQRMRRLLELLLERVSNMAEFWHLYSMALEGCGRPTDAKVAHGLCLEIEPLHVNANLQRIQRRSEGLAARRQWGDALWPHRPRCEPLHLMMAELEAELGQPLKKERRLERAIELFPQSIQPRLALKQFYLSQERPDLADKVSIPKAHLLNPEQDAEAPAAESEAVDLDAEAKDTPTLLRLLEMALASRQDQSRSRAKEPEWRADQEAIFEELGRRFRAGLLEPFEDLEYRRAVVLQALLNEDQDPLPILRSTLPTQIPDPVSANAQQFLAGLPIPKARENAVLKILFDWMDGHLSKYEADLDGALMKAQLLTMKGQPKKAKHYYQQALAIAEHPEAHYQLALLALKENAIDEAIDQFKACIQLAPNNLSAWGTLAEIYKAMKKPDERHTALMNLVALQPYSPLRADDLLYEYSEQRDNKKLPKWLSANGKRYPVSMVHFWHGRAALLEGSFIKARSYISHELKESKSYSYYWLQLQLDIKDKRWKSLKTMITEALEAFPGDEFFTVMALRFTSRVSATTSADMEKYVLACPTPAVFDTWVRVFDLLPYQAMKQILTNVVESSKMTQLLSAVMEVFHEPEHQIIMKRIFERIEPQNADNIVLLVALIQLDHKREDPANARRLKVLFKLDPNRPFFLRLAGQYWAVSEPLKAAHYFERHLALTEDLESRVNWANCLHNADKTQSAIKLLKPCLESSDWRLPASMLLDKWGAAPDLFWPAMCEAMKGPPQPEFPYAAVTAVRVALAVEQALPRAWLAWALARAKRLRKEPLGDEQRVLLSMLYAWCHCCSNTALFKQQFGTLKSWELWMVERNKPWRRSAVWVPQ